MASQALSFCALLFREIRQHRISFYSARDEIGGTPPTVGLDLGCELIALCSHDALCSTYFKLVERHGDMRRCEMVTRGPYGPIPIFAVEAVIHMQESAHKVRQPAWQVVLSRMQLTLHATRRTPHGASCLVHAMSAWSMKTRRSPSRHCRDAGVYSHMTTYMHEMSTLPLATVSIASW